MCTNNSRLRYLCQVASEECSEITQALSKISRFGVYNTNPDTGDFNYNTLMKEVNDLLAVLEMLEEEGVPMEGIMDHGQVEAKKAKVEKYMKVSEAEGLL